MATSFEEKTGRAGRPVFLQLAANTTIRGMMTRKTTGILLWPVVVTRA